MLKIGITGGIGSGKTTICKFFELLGVPVYYADDVSKELLHSDPEIKEKMLSVFGNEILDDHQQISRKKIAERVFNNEKELKQLNAIIHPAVALHFEEWLLQYATYPYIIKEAAILFESGAYRQLDKIISIVAPVEQRIRRVVKRDGTSDEEVKKRMLAQLSDEERIARSQFIIENNGMQLVIPQVLKLHNKFVNEIG